MNSVLQSVSYLKPMQELFLQKLHKPKCKRVSFCIVCTMEEHINRTFEASKPFTPKAFAFNLKKIAKHFRLGRQEDSHEFLRFLIDGMVLMVNSA
jgi:ubiquitin carboxyl-terminal hydrolase 36/42